MISGYTGGLLAREAEAAQITLKSPYMAIAAHNSSVDCACVPLVDRSGIYTHDWFDWIEKSRGGKSFECTIDESLQFFHLFGSP